MTGADLHRPGLLSGRGVRTSVALLLSSVGAGSLAVLAAVLSGRDEPLVLLLLLPVLHVGAAVTAFRATVVARRWSEPLRGPAAALAVSVLLTLVSLWVTVLTVTVTWGLRPG